MTTKRTDGSAGHRGSFSSTKRKPSQLPTNELPVEVQVAILTGIFGIVTSIISAIVVVINTRTTNRHEDDTKKHLEEQSKTLKSVQQQTNNNHGTNLRDDMDAIRDDIKDMQKGMKDGLNDVRGDVSELKSDVSDLRRQTAQVHDGLNNANRSSNEEYKRLWEHLSQAEKELDQRRKNDSYDAGKWKQYGRDNDLAKYPKRRDGRGSGGN